MGVCSPEGAECRRKGCAVPQSLANILIHLVFSTKDRRPLIRPPVEQELYAYLVGVCRGLGCPSHQIGGTEDHVHIFFSLSRTLSISGVVEEVKTSSSKWIKTKGPAYRQFAWQKGYGAFSIGQSSAAALRRYILNQRKRHGRVTFQDEFRDLLKKYNVEYDERYVWE